MAQLNKDGSVAVYAYTGGGRYNWAIVAYTRGAPQRFFRFRGVENTYKEAATAFYESKRRRVYTDTIYVVRSIPFPMCDIVEIPWKVDAI